MASNPTVRNAARLAATLAVLAIGGLALAPKSQALGPNDYIGRIALLGTTFCPRATLEADGRLLNIAEHSGLYSVIGATFGGDGKKTFALPDLRGKAPVADMRYCIVVDGIYPTRN